MEENTRNPESHDGGTNSWEREAWGWDNGTYWESTQNENLPQLSHSGHSDSDHSDGLAPVANADGSTPLPTAQVPWMPESQPRPPDAGTASETVERETARGPNWKGIVYEVLETLILTFLIFVLMRALVQNYRIDGYSMEPTLHEDQRLFVSKVSYYFGEPQRGDIIVFEYPNSSPGEQEKDYIKRVIGLPGDTVECKPGEILVNGQVINEGAYNPHPNNYSCPPTTLGPNEYYVLGDNRNQSSDSHAWGPLERKYIIGKAWLMYWPLKDLQWMPNYRIEAPRPETVVRSP